MKIMTYNILLGGEDRLEHLMNTICAESPSVLCLQEANEFEQDNYKKLKTISEAAHLPYTALALGTKRKSGKQFHVATLSQYPIVHESLLRGFHHACLHTILDTELGKLSFANVHLCPGNEETRVGEVERVIRTQSEFQRAVILGDHNALSPLDYYEDQLPRFPQGLQHFVKDKHAATDAITQILEAGYVDTAYEKGYGNISTFPSPLSHHKDGFHFRIDYIFITPQLTKHLGQARVVNSNASDHYPYCVELRQTSSS